MAEKEIEQIQGVCEPNDITMEVIKEISEIFNVGDQIKGDGQEIGGAKDIVPSSFQRSLKFKIAKCK
jgi:ribosomal protein S1